MCNKGVELTIRPKPTTAILSILPRGSAYDPIAALSVGRFELESDEKLLGGNCWAMSGRGRLDSNTAREEVEIIQAVSSPSVADR